MHTSKFLLFITLGTVFWFTAALIVHFTGAAVFTAGNPRLFLVFLLAVPLTLASMYLTKVISNTGFAKLLRPVVVMTCTATFLDGIALAWFRQLYSSSFEVALHGAAWILWGAGWGLLFAYYFEARGASHQPS